jgi:cytochrome c-type biogenesis protein CcmH
MKLLRIFLFIIIVFNTNQAFSDENNNKLKNKISKNIRCLICQGQSIYDSQSDFAISMKLVIEKKLNQGFSENEIYEFLKNKYGQWIIYDPEFNKKTFILWILPILLFLLGGAIIYRKLNVQK